MRLLLMDEVKKSDFKKQVKKTKGKGRTFPLFMWNLYVL